MENNAVISIEQQFGEVIDIILQHKSRATKVVNEELLLTAWHVGGYVSAKLKSEEWGSKVVTQLSEYIRSQHPNLKGYSKLAYVSGNSISDIMFDTSKDVYVYEQYSLEVKATIKDGYDLPSSNDTSIVLAQAEAPNNFIGLTGIQ
jgi:hypothetical protein